MLATCDLGNDAAVLFVKGVLVRRHACEHVATVAYDRRRRIVARRFDAEQKHYRATAFRYAVGVHPTIRRNACEKCAMLPKPLAAEISSTDSFVRSSCARACPMRMAVI